MVVDPEITFKIDDKSKEHRNSSSSEEHIDTSDELMEVDLDINDRFIADCQEEANRQQQARQIADPQPSRGEMIICEAEMGKARIYGTPGKQANNVIANNCSPKSLVVGPMSTVVDEFYIMVGAHIDDSLQEKIRQCEYVDFARLLPREHGHEEDHRMELVYKNGQTYFIPASERDNSGGVTSFHKWEQAFRVFSNIYLKQYPEKATELIEYNHIICTASAAYVWENVYTYDKEFCRHLA